MNVNKAAYLATVALMILPFVYPVEAQTLVTSCTYSPDGGAWAWAQVQKPPGATGYGWAKLISYKGSGAYAEFWVVDQLGGWWLTGHHAFTGSGQQWAVSGSPGFGAASAQMRVYDGNSNQYMGTATATATQSGPNPPGNCPTNPIKP